MDPLPGRGGRDGDVRPGIVVLQRRRRGGGRQAGAVNTGYATLRGLAYYGATHYLYYLSEQARRGADYLDHIDVQWSVYTTQGDPDTDGIVPGQSQQYPSQGLATGPGSALRQVMIGPGSGPSHVVEPRSRDVINATSDLLDTFFNIRSYPRQVP